ncbi:SWIM-type domain-containing protein [Mycena sanguinolenta]|uniref:SWIM-type domain-containing protein n=1 Tax=Mycena sanguinolenta TaxID=230812 RepID=A0A8H6YWP7_9AGAR|nr:SWIM-type domain-containing protein [Mycena sanguinolenta]
MDNSSSDTEIPPGMKECAKTWCHTLLPINDKKADAAAVPPATTKSKKRKPSGTSTNDERPAARPRLDGTANSDEESEDGCEAPKTFADAESFFDELRKEFRSKQSVDFHGTYKLAADELITSKQRVQMVAAEIWKTTGYRFTVANNRELKSGHRTRLWCCQDEGRKKKSKASHDPDIRNRDYVGMKRFPCKSKLAISCRTSRDDDDELVVTVELKHGQKHTAYTNVSMPQEALDMIRDNVEWLTPVAMVSKVQATFPTVTAAQIHRAWMEMSEIHWRRDDLQLPSATKMLEEHGEDVDIFKPENIPEGVEMLCWGMKKIAGPLQGKIFEIGVDATCTYLLPDYKINEPYTSTDNTNSKHLELYSIMGEYNNAGFPLSYLFLSTASSISQGKRRTALTAWATCLRDAYGITARFTHVDKDMAEIGMLKDVWNAKISLCWWHLRHAVRTRLASSKLATTPYDAARANAEFSFIDVQFVPLGQVDGEEYEGGVHENIISIIPASERRETMEMPNGLRITITIPATQAPPRSVACEGAPAGVGGSKTATAEPRRPKNSGTYGEPEDIGTTAKATPHQTTRRGREIKPPTWTADAADPAVVARAMNARVPGTATSKAAKRQKPPADSEVSDVAETSSSEDEGEEDKRKARRTFCPASYREPIITMMERHFCAHPLLPGSAHPSPAGIRRWAVMEMYKFCVENRLREVWAYLWENWYRQSRWELWARSVHPEIPVLKTTMILESHWRRIKHDFLHHFHMPRCDLLAWILIVKLAPTYYRKLERLLTDTGRYRELPSWRKSFKKTWRKLEKTPITIPVNPAYKTDTKKMLCTCPSLAPSRFLLCKHTVQGMKPVPPVFFLEVKRQRTAPFWVHPSLQPLSDDAGAGANSGGVEEQQVENPLNDAMDSDEGDDGDDEEDDDLIDTQFGADQLTFLEAMDEKIEIVSEFLKGLKYQRQFRDQRMLQTLEREGASFFRLANACLTKEKRLASTRGEAPSTWDPSASSAMFYRARPGRSDENT